MCGFIYAVNTATPSFTSLRSCVTTPVCSGIPPFSMYLLSINYFVSGWDKIPQKILLFVSKSEIIFNCSISRILLFGIQTPLVHLHWSTILLCCQLIAFCGFLLVEYAIWGDNPDCCLLSSQAANCLTRSILWFSNVTENFRIQYLEIFRYIENKI